MHRRRKRGYREHPPPPKIISRNYSSGKYHVKFGHVVNFAYIYFRAKIFNVLCLASSQSWPIRQFCSGNATTGKDEKLIGDKAPLEGSRAESWPPAIGERLQPNIFAEGVLPSPSCPLPFPSLPHSFAQNPARGVYRAL